MSHLKKIKRTFLLSSISIFLISLTQRAYCVDNNCGDLGSGFLCFALGWLGLGYGGALFTWFANPFLILSWAIPYKYHLLKIFFCFISSLISLSFLFFDRIMKDESGHSGEITGYALGYWLWLSSSVIFLCGNIYIFLSGKGFIKKA